MTILIIAMKPFTHPLPYLTLDCSSRYVAHIQYSLDQMGFAVMKIVPQYSFLLGYSFRLYFAQPIPALSIEIMLEASVSNPTLMYSLCDN